MRWRKIKKILLEYKQDDDVIKKNNINESVLVKEITTIIKKKNKPIDTSGLLK
jgi:hypothetical protein